MSLHFKKLNSNSTQPKKMVILSHGYGADCSDLLSIGEYWQRFLPDFCFVAPNAPTPCQINSSGFEWFDLMQTSQEKIIEEFQSSLKLLDLFINTQLKEYCKQKLFSIHVDPDESEENELKNKEKENQENELDTYFQEEYTKDYLKNIQEE